MRFPTVTTPPRIINHRRSVFLVALLFLPIVLSATSLWTAPRAHAAGLWSTAYYISWEQETYPPNTLPWGTFNYLIHFEIMTGAARNGTVDYADLNPQLMTEAVAAAHQHGTKILLSIGGNADDNWDAACNSTNRATFITNLINMMKQYGYDGIDLDIEQDWGAPDHVDYIACVSGIRSALNQLTPRPILTEAADSGWQQDMLYQVWTNLDQINLMSYNDEGAQLQTDVDNYTSMGIPKSLLGMGIGISTGDQNGSDSTPQDCTNKAQFAKDNGLGGVMEWTLQLDPTLHNGQFSCLNAVAAVLGFFTPTPTLAPTPRPVASPISPSKTSQPSVSPSSTATRTHPTKTAPVTKTPVTRYAPTADNRSWPIAIIAVLLLIGTLLSATGVSILFIIQNLLLHRLPGVRVE